MKKFLSIVFFLFSIQLLNAQSEKYQQAMEANIKAFDTVYSAAGHLALANSFSRIAEAEKNQWLPYYYAALSQVMSGMMSSGNNGQVDASITDPLADKAEAFLVKAEALAQPNSELFVVKKMIATLRMMADPMTRWQTYGPIAAEALQAAKKMNPNNPRVFLLEGQDKFYTPVEFGGSKDEAKLLFEESIRKFETEKPETSLHPQWGLRTAQYFHAQCK